MPADYLLIKKEEDLMKNFIILILTVLFLAFGNWLATLFFNASLVDLSIPFALVSIFIIYIFTNKGNALGRQIDSQIQGQTGIKMAITNRVTNHSYVFIGSVIYFFLTLVFTFFVYREYFIS